MDTFLYDICSNWPTKQWQIQSGFRGSFEPPPRPRLKISSVRPNYFIFIGYLRKKNEIKSANRDLPQSYTYETPFPDILNPPLLNISLPPSSTRVLLTQSASVDTTLLLDWSTALTDSGG